MGVILMGKKERGSEERLGGPSLGFLRFLYLSDLRLSTVTTLALFRVQSWTSIGESNKDKVKVIDSLHFIFLPFLPRRVIFYLFLSNVLVVGG
jgi:hypothetical protein